MLISVVFFLLGGIVHAQTVTPQRLLQRWDESLQQLTRIHYRSLSELRFEGAYDFDVIPRDSRRSSVDLFRDGGRMAIRLLRTDYELPQLAVSGSEISFNVVVGAENLASKYAISTETQGTMPIESLVVHEGPATRWMPLMQGGEVLEGFWAATGSFESIIAQMLSAPRLAVRAQAEEIDGRLTYVIDADTDYGEFSVWVDPEAGFLPRRMEHRKSKGDQRGATRRFGEDIAPPPSDGGRSVPRVAEESMVIVIEDIEIQQVDALFVPMSATSTKTVKYVDGSSTVERGVHRREGLELNPDFVGRAAFKIDAPSGLPVFFMDELRGGVSFEWHDGQIIPSVDKAVLARIEEESAIYSGRVPTDKLPEGVVVAKLASQDSSRRTFRSLWSSVIALGAIAAFIALVVWIFRMKAKHT